MTDRDLMIAPKGFTSAMWLGFGIGFGIGCIIGFMAIMMNYLT